MLLFPRMKAAPRVPLLALGLLAGACTDRACGGLGGLPPAPLPMVKQGNREPDAYGLIPSSSPVESRWGWQGPITADHPYGTA